MVILYLLLRANIYQLPFSDCDDLVAPTQGFLSSTSNVHGSHVTVSCNNGYSLSGERTLVCLSGSLSGTIGTCDAGRFVLLFILKGSTAFQLFVQYQSYVYIEELT